MSKLTQKTNDIIRLMRDLKYHILDEHRDQKSMIIGLLTNKLDVASAELSGIAHILSKLEKSNEETTR